MKIIKKATSIGVVGNVVNEKTTSDKDTYSCDYINNKMKLLWEAPTIEPTDGFTLDINTTDYDLLLVTAREYVVSSTNYSKRITSNISPKGLGGYVVSFYNQLNTSIRRYDITIDETNNKTTIEFGNGSANGSNSNLYVIPYRIYGIKL